MISILIKKRLFSRRIECSSDQLDLSSYSFLYNGYRDLSLSKNKADLGSTDGEKYVVLPRVGRLEVRRSKAAYCYEAIQEGNVIFDIDEFADGFGSKFFYQDVMISSNKKGLNFRIRCYLMRFFLPLKLEAFIDEEIARKDGALDVVLMWLGYEWLKKECSSHDALN